MILLSVLVFYVYSFVNTCVCHVYFLINLLNVLTYLFSWHEGYCREQPLFVRFSCGTHVQVFTKETCTYMHLIQKWKAPRNKVVHIKLANWPTYASFTYYLDFLMKWLVLDGDCGWQTLLQQRHTVTRAVACLLVKLKTAEVESCRVRFLCKSVVNDSFTTRRSVKMCRVNN